MNYKTKTGFRREHDRKKTQAHNLRLDPKTGELLELPSMTKQAFVDQCDINNIIKQFKVTGMVQHMSAKAAQGSYEDLPDEIDFQTSLQIVMEGQNAFATLPSKIRSRFDNDPALFLEFMANPANQEEIYSLGLATRPPPAPPADDSPPAPPGPTPS